MEERICKMENEKINQEGDFYYNLREKFRKWASSEDGKKNKWAEYLLFAPDLFHLLCKLSIDPDVPVKEKAKLAGAIAYFVSPIDLVPEAIVGPIGYVDDIALSALVLNSIIKKTKPDVVKKHWAGDEDVLVVIKKILEVADQMVGIGLWKKLKKLFSF
jgi:uncharacterized membrane protein YkvA (DUF1232 family)